MRVGDLLGPVKMAMRKDPHFSQPLHLVLYGLAECVKNHETRK